MTPVFEAEDRIPNLRPDPEARRRMQDRIDRLRTDPDYRARQSIRARIGADNSLVARGGRNIKVTLPKFSWDEK